MTAAGVPAPTTAPMTRREFLYYVWGASMALFMAEFGGAIVWFALPRFKAGEFGGKFELDLSAIPLVDDPPKDFPDGRFWLVNIGPKRKSDPRQPADYAIEQEGVAAIYKVCVHLGCLYKWVPVNDRFECPCHGSKYLATGVRIDGPARRNLDVFIMEFQDANGATLAKTQSGDPGAPGVGAPIPVPPGATKIVIDTGKRIQGGVNTQPGGGR